MNFDNLVGWGGWVKGSKIFKHFFLRRRKYVVVGNYKKYKGQWVSGPHSEYFIHSKLFLDLHLLVPCTINYRKRAEQDGERGEDET